MHQNIRLACTWATAVFDFEFDLIMFKTLWIISRLWTNDW